MPSTVPNITSLRLLNRTLDLSTGTIDCHLITSMPSASASTGADLSTASGGNYAPQSATISTPASNGTGAISALSSSTIQWTSLYCGAATPIVGVAFTKRAGGSYASTDPIVSAIEFTTPTTIPNVSTTSGRSQITSSAAFGSVTAGMAVSGANIPTETIVIDAPDSSMLRLNKAATGTGTITLTAQIPAPYTPPTSSGSGVNFSFTVPSTGILKLDKVQ